MMHPPQAVDAQNYGQWGLEQLADFVEVRGSASAVRSAELDFWLLL